MGCSPGQPKSVMMRNSVLFIMLFLGSFPIFSQTYVWPDNEKIKYTGRIDFSDPKMPVFSYSGVTIETEFTGTSVTVGLILQLTGITITVSWIILTRLRFIFYLRIPSYDVATGLRDTVHHLKAC